jgi:hypothetical protein
MLDLGSGAVRHAGSTPVIRTRLLSPRVMRGFLWHADMGEKKRIYPPTSDFSALSVCHLTCKNLFNPAILRIQSRNPALQCFVILLSKTITDIEF